MNITKAVITAAGKGQRELPLQRLVDRDGVSKTALQIIIEEARSAGAEEICVVIRPGDEPRFLDAAGSHSDRLQFVRQDRPLGYGHALHCARAFVGHAPFLHMVSDHMYISHTGERCARQLVQTAVAENCALSAVQPTRETMLPQYGAIGGRRVTGRHHLYQIENVIEKPTPTEAEQHLIVPGLRAGHYLCFFGMHVLTATVMELLGEMVAAAGEAGNVQLSPALARLAGREKYLALEVAGSRHNIGDKYGLLTGQLALALSGNDRDEVLVHLLELAAQYRR